ncbi:MAG: hypothetical protein EBQ87_10525 [Planctomycetes bacterium]|nr:hypothetical protein [Planctomycetota bacterium]
MGNQNLPAESGGSALLALEKISGLGVNPATQSGCTKVVSQLDIRRFSLVRSGGTGFLGWAKIGWQATKKTIKAVKIDSEHNFKCMNTLPKNQ